MKRAEKLWFETMQNVAVDQLESSEKWQNLNELYGQSTRHYHSMTHIEKLVESMYVFAPQASTSMRLAIFYHDAIYDTRRNDNEEESARLAAESLSQLNLGKNVIDETCRLILCTKTHQPDSVDSRDEACLFLDLDLLILGAEPHEYETYSKKIRAEYSWVPVDAYRSGRGSVLQSFLDRECIYFSPEVHSLFENRARANVLNELAVLKSQALLNKGIE